MKRLHDVTHFNITQFSESSTPAAYLTFNEAWLQRGPKNCPSKNLLLLSPESRKSGTVFTHDFRSCFFSSQTYLSLRIRRNLGSIVSDWVIQAPPNLLECMTQIWCNIAKETWLPHKSCSRRLLYIKVTILCDSKKEKLWVMLHFSTLRLKIVAG